MMRRHLPAAVAALILFGGALVCADSYLERLQTRHVHALAPQMFVQKTSGTALQRIAFQQADLLPIYGSSDLNLRNPYHASALFREYPTGFTVFPVGSAGSSSLNWVQALAAVGADLEGKLVAVSVPARAFLSERIDARAYAANFSPLHAGELAFNTGLGFAVKQAAARRMLQYPETVKHDPLLAFALAQLADGSSKARFLYYASMPLGKLHNLLLRLQDNWEMFLFLRSQVGLGQIRQQIAHLDWPQLLNRAEQEARRNSDNNRFGFDNEFWAAHAAEITMQKGAYRSVASVHDVQRSAEWADLDLLLQAIGDLGGKPLILVIPMNSAYYDHLGLLSKTRQGYSDGLRKLAAAHGVQLLDFVAPESAEYFTVDSGLHLSSKGWIHYSRALDAFYHGRKVGDA